MRSYIPNVKKERSLIVSVGIAVIVLIQFGAIEIREQFADAVHKETERDLNAQLDAIYLTLDRWFDKQSSGVRYWSQQGDVISATEELEQLAHSAEKLRAADAQQRLREKFSPLLNEMGYKGYFIVDRSLNNLASSRDSNIGSTNLLAEQADFFAKLRDGDTALSLPLTSDVPLGEPNSSDLKSSTMFVGSPIIDPSANVIGYFLFRLSVPDDFIKVFELQQNTSSGEVLAYDRKGRLLNRSRHEMAIDTLEAGQNSQYQARLSDHMAKIITSEESRNRQGRSSLFHFHDFRGVESVAVARWLSSFNFGIIAKLDQAEEHKTLEAGLRMMDYMTIGGTLLATLLAVIFYLLRLNNWRTHTSLAAIFHNSGEGIVTINKQSVIESINPAAAEMFGYDVSELIGKNVNILMPESLRHKHDNYVKQSELHEARVINQQRDLYGQHKDGRAVPVSLNVTRMQQGDHDLFIGIIHDITDRITYENQLRRFKTTLDQTMDSVFMFDPDSLKFFYANMGAQEQVGYLEEELCQMTPLDIKPDMNETRFRQMIAPMLNHEVRGISFETIHQHKNGERFPVEVSVQYVDPEHEKPRMVAIVRNIQQRKDTEEILKRKEDLLRRSQQIAGVGSWEWDLNSNALTWTDETYRMFAVDKQTTEPSYELFMERVHSDDRHMVEEALTSAINGENEPYDIKHRYILPDGEIRHVHEIGKVYHDAQGTSTRMTGVVQDITAQVEADEKLNNEKMATEAALKTLRLTQQALEYTGFGEYWISADTGRIMRVNDHACKHLGYSRDELLQKRVADFAPHWPEDKWEEMVAPLKEQGWGRFEDFHQRSNGTIVPVEITAMYLPHGESDEEMFVTFVLDITDRKRAEEELIQSRETAEAAVQAKSAFLATMSHEIRTPMNGVIGMIELLKNSPLNGEQHRMVGVVQESSQALLRIIDDILDLSKIEAGKMTVEATPFSITDVLDSVADIMRPVAQAKPLRFYLYEDPTLPNQVVGDPVRLRQILYNLSGNAIKFCEANSGTVELSASLLEKQDSKDQHCWVRFTINDNGIGMDEEVVNSLFTPFFQAEASTTRRFGGTGLGLSICKSLSEMMGGNVTVESTLHRGTTFTVDLPFEAVKSEALAPSGPLIDDLQLLFYVPDVREWRNIETYAESEGYKYNLASNEEALMSHINAGNNPDVVLLFQPFTGTVSEKMLDRLRQRLPESRFVLAVPDADTVMSSAMKDTVLVENYPLKPQALHRSIATAVGRASPEIIMEHQETLKPAVLMSREQAHAAGKLILVVEDNPTNQEVIIRQLQLLGYAADVASDGREALQMWREEPYALVLTDCHMPEMDGYQLTVAIREEEERDGREHSKIVAITANALEGEGEKCLLTGMDGYLSKPLELSRLKQELERWIPASPQVGDEDEPPPLPPLNQSLR